MFYFPQVSRQRSRVIVREAAAGSRPHGRFFVLLIAASMIASIGLIANSTAVIIGAMLVSPLMTPIFGIALGMLRGNSRLLWRSVASEMVGVVLAVGTALLVGASQLSFGEATPEILARTQPNLHDLLVAIFAGFAGAYALVDERVSPALPGVAIATAIVPPLATCGLCLSFGATSGAAGAMLLFIANFVSILAVAILTFMAGGLGRARHRTFRRVVAHLGPTTVAFAVLAVVLTNSLTRIIRDHNLDRGIQQVLAEKIAAAPGANLVEMVHTNTAEKVQVLATVRSQRTISPTWVSSIQSALAEAVGMPVDLVIRTMRSRDVCASGSSLQAIAPDMDGNLLVSASHDDEAREMLASQVIREIFEQEPGFELTRVEYGSSASDQGLVVAYVNAIRRLTRGEIGLIEELLQERLGNTSLRFLVRVNSAILQERGGSILSEWTNVTQAGPERVAQLPSIEKTVRNAVENQSDLIPLDMHFNWTDGHWKVLVEVTGPRTVLNQDVQQIQGLVAQVYNKDVTVLLWHRSDLIATGEVYTTYDRLTDPLIEERRARLYELFRTQAQVPKPAQDETAAVAASVP